MKVFISYRRADTKAREYIEDLLKDNDISFYAVPKNVNFDGENHQYIKDTNIARGCTTVMCFYVLWVKILIHGHMSIGSCMKH